MIQDHKPVPIDRFLGLYGIDSFTDSVPPGYFVDELNTITYGDDVRTRDGFGLAHSTGVVKRFEVYRRQGEASRLLVLVGSSIIDLTTGVTILTVAGMTDFAINYMNGRAFISPHNGISGLPGSFVYIYNGTGVARKACGSKPVAGFNAIISTTTGVIEKGTHIFAWVFETDTGFITAPSPAKTLVMDGTKKVNFTNIPVGPVGTLGRRLIASMAIQDYNGNELGYEMFFVSGGRIANNTVTTLNDIDFYDVDLQFSADYVYDQLEEIPAVVFIRPYGRRMVFGGPDIDKNLVFFSKPMEPESIHSSAGFLAYDPFETEGVKDGTEHRDNFYVTKKNKTYTVRDNGYEPSTWNPIPLDASVGCDVNGIARFLDSTGSKVEFFVVTNPAGIFKFTGIYEEIPLTRNIKVFWKKISRKYFHLMQTVFDQENLLLYVLAPYDGSTIPNVLFVCNYENGFQLDRIKWHKWKFKDFSPLAIGIDKNLEGKPVLKVSSSTSGIYVQEKDRREDNLTIIETFIKFAYVSGGANTIHHVGGVGFRIKGTGLLKLILEGEDDVEYQNLPDLNLSCAPGKEFMALAHFQSEKISLTVSMIDVGEHFRIYSIYLYTNEIFLTRPLV